MLPVVFGGLQALVNDEQTAFEDALEAHNCYLDEGRPAPRNGYNNATASAIGSGTVQTLVRFRPSLSSARTVAAVGGTIYTITDPSSDTASDGTVANLGAPFSTTAVISAAQLGRYLYIGTDEPNVAMRRINSTYAMEALESLPVCSPPNATLSTSNFVVYRTLGLSYTTTSGLSLRTSGIPSTWYRAANATDTGDCAVGQSVYFTLATEENWNGVTWVAVVCSPHDTGSKDGAVKISVTRQVSGAPGVFEEIGTIWDTPGQAGTPNLIFCDVRGLTDATKSAVKYIKFEIATGRPTSTYRFAVYGHCALPSPPLQSPEKYYVDIYRTSTQQASPISSVKEVTISDADVLVPTYDNLYLDRGVWRSAGQRDILSGGNDRNFNRFAGLAHPKARSEIGVRVTLSGTLPTGFTGTVSARVWRDTQEGRRLVGEHTGLSAGGSYSVVDRGGYRIFANLKYRPIGTPPRCRALAARSQRLIAGYENRLHISSYIPIGAEEDNFPVFPDIPEEASDGWAFDIAPNRNEQILSIINGDALYILTNLNCYSMSELEPGSLPYLIFNRGVVGRNAALFAENMLFWAGYDGIYSTRNRVETTELTAGIRRIYEGWFGAGSDTVLGYQSRKLYAFRGTKFLRYDFVRGLWTRGEIAHTPVRAVSWYDPGDSTERLWIMFSNRHIGRWLKSATSDAGTAIARWEYSTGFYWSPVPLMVKMIYVDCDGEVEAGFCTTTTERPGSALYFQKGETQRPVPPVPRSFKIRLRFEGDRETKIHRAVAWVQPVSGAGQADGTAGTF